MKMSDLKPASSFAQNLGVKMVAYGPPGEGKTPLIKTAPRPVLLITEPGLLSMRDATNIPAWEGFTPSRISEFFTWIKDSAEAKNFDTVCVDSMSQMAEIELKQALKEEKHGLKAYGRANERSMERAEILFFLPQKHVYLIAKQTQVDENGIMKRRPYFPGQELNVKIPHLFDVVAHVSKTSIPGVIGPPQLAIRTAGTIDIMARDRSGRLNELEPPDLSALFKKAMA